MRKPTNGRYNSREELIEAICSYLAQGKTWFQVEHMTGVSSTTAAKLFKEHQKAQALEALKTSPCPAIPQHHIQWFETLKAACRNDDLALISCRDMVTGEPRSVIAILQKDGEDFAFTPLGNLATTDNPFDAYIPPSHDQRSVQ